MCNIRGLFEKQGLKPFLLSQLWLAVIDRASLHEQSMVLNLKTATQNAQLLSYKNASLFYSLSLQGGEGEDSVFITNESIEKWKISPPVKKASKHDQDHR